MSELVLVEFRERGVALVTLNRPDRRNALNLAMLDQLGDALERLASDSANRVVILRGAGPVFSAGLDLHEAAEASLIEQSAASLSRALRLLQTSPLVAIAAVQGGAFAGGAGLMAACDIVIAAANSTIGFPEARRGLLPALISDVLKHKVREGDLRYLLLAGESIDALHAERLGLVQRVVSTERLLDEALSVANSIIAGGPNTIRQTRAFLGAMYQHVEDTPVQDMVKLHLSARRGDEAREGLAAFAEKREPKWS